MRDAMSSERGSGGSPRIEWIDALRGFSMLLVVSYHVAQICFDINLKKSSSMPLLLLVRMPLFFFISGFLAYKPALLWTGRRACAMAWKKVRVQVVPAFLFLCVSVAITCTTKSPFLSGLQSALSCSTKGGYWFTWVLLLMLLLYYAVCSLAAWSSRLGEPPGSEAAVLPGARERSLQDHAILALFIVSLALYETAYVPQWDKALWQHPWAYACSVRLLVIYLPFFLFGNLARRHWTGLQRLLESRWFFPVLVGVAFFSACEAIRWHTLRHEWANLPRTLAMYSLLLVVVATFRHHQAVFSRRTAVGRGLQCIGRRTLDIYLLHFILMPRLRMCKPFFDNNPQDFLIEQAIFLALALLVTGACLLVSALLRTSPLLAKWLFGAEKKRPRG